MKVHEGKKVISEDIKTNIEDGTTEVNTDEDGKKHTIFSDYNKVCIIRSRLVENGLPILKMFIFLSLKTYVNRNVQPVMLTR